MVLCFHITNWVSLTQMFPSSLPDFFTARKLESTTRWLEEMYVVVSRVFLPIPSAWNMGQETVMGHVQIKWQGVDAFDSLRGLYSNQEGLSEGPGPNPSWLAYL